MIKGIGNGIICTILDLKPRKKFNILERTKFNSKKGLNLSIFLLGYLES